MVIFLKNIDNVSQNNRILISDYKKALGAIIIKTQRKIFQFLNDLESKDLTESDFKELIFFIEKMPKNLNLSIIGLLSSKGSVNSALFFLENNGSLSLLISNIIKIWQILL